MTAAIPHSEDRVSPATCRGSKPLPLHDLASWVERAVGEGVLVGANVPPRAVIAPHVDPAVGARVYGSAYRCLEGHPARRIVVLGVGHAAGGPPFVTVDHPIQTPFGPCPVDGGLLRSLRDGLPFDATDAHGIQRVESSILCQALFLRHVLGGWEQRQLIPILCCFPGRPATARRAPSGEDTAIEEFLRRLGGIVDAETLVVAGVDLAHIGPIHGDPAIDEACRSRIRSRDMELMDAVLGADLEGFERMMDRDQSTSRICGVGALWSLMKILPGRTGILLDYGQAVDAGGRGLVSFAAGLLR